MILALKLIDLRHCARSTCLRPWKCRKFRRLQRLLSMISNDKYGYRIFHYNFHIAKTYLCKCWNNRSVQAVLVIGNFVDSSWISNWPKILFKLYVKMISPWTFEQSFAWTRWRKLFDFTKKTFLHNYSYKDLQEYKFQKSKILIFKANGFKSFVISSLNASEWHNIDKFRMASFRIHAGPNKVNVNVQFWHLRTVKIFYL